VGGSAWLRLVVAVLATWRVTHLLALEDGPWRVLVRLRARLGDGVLGALMDCFQCLSLWVAMAFVPAVTREWSLAVPVWLALSGAACLLERLGGAPPVVVQPFNDQTTGGPGDGMLWTGTERAAGEREPAERGHDAAHGAAPPHDDGA
jgi:hypothetical protein